MFVNVKMVKNFDWKLLETLPQAEEFSFCTIMVIWSYLKLLKCFNLASLTTNPISVVVFLKTCASR